MELPIDFHCHGVGNFDPGVPEQIDLFQIDELLKSEGVCIVLVLSLPRSKMNEFEALLRQYDNARKSGLLTSILGIGIEGPALAHVGGTPETGCWTPTQTEWNRISALGALGLLYTVISPDASLNLGPHYPQDTLSVAKLLARNGVMPALGHFNKSDPETAAKMINCVCNGLEVAGLGPAITDHLFNDMPINFKHAWRTQADKTRRTQELELILAQPWSHSDMSTSLGPVPAAIIRQALNGNLKICLNFDGDHVDMEICKRAVEFIGSQHILLMTDRIPGRILGGQLLEQRPCNALLYQKNGIVAGGSRPLIVQLRNMKRVGISEEAIHSIAFGNAFNLLQDHAANASSRCGPTKLNA